MMTKAKPEGLELLREPFADNQISKLPKETRQQIDARKNREAGCMVWNCSICGGHHHKDAVHLDYVGHAALTHRLLDADPHWTWEPFGTDERGLPALTSDGGLWINLTVCGMTRPGVGYADGKTGGDAMKERIGDALRNAAMRFGAALDLWHKGDLHGGDDDTGGGIEGMESKERRPPPRTKLTGPYESITGLESAIRGFVSDMDKCATWEDWQGLQNDGRYKGLLEQAQRDHPDWWNGWPGQPDRFVPLSRRIEVLEANLAADKARMMDAG